MLLLVVGVLADCRARPQGAQPPLGDPELVQWNVITEAAVLGMPSSWDANRLLNGFWPTRSAGETGLYLEDRVSLSFATLRARERRLELEWTAPTDLEERTLSVERNGVPVPVAMARDRRGLSVLLPPGAGPSVDYLELRGGSGLLLEAARFSDEPRPGRFASGDKGLVLKGTVLLRAPLGETKTSSRLRGRITVSVEGQSRPGLVEIWQDSERIFRWESEAKNGAATRDLGVDISLIPTRASLLSLLVSDLDQAVVSGFETIASAAEAPGPRAGCQGVGALAAAPSTVIVYVLDALRADGESLLPAGEERLSALAGWGGEARIYGDHRAVAPNTLPSTKALLTGKVWRQRGGWQLPGASHTIADEYAGAGYVTAVFSHNPYISADYGIAQPFDHDHTHPAHDIDRVNDDAERINAEVLAWLRGVPRETPVFLYAHVLNPHNPYTAPTHASASSDSRSLGSTEALLDIAAARRELSERDQQAVRDLYANGIRYADRQLERLLAELAELRDASEILLVVTSDHGEELFDHGGVLHGYTLYEEQLRIPLVIRWPEAIAGGFEQRRTSALDLHRTLVEVARSATASGRPADACVEGAPTLAAAMGVPDGRVHFAAAASIGGGIFSALSGRDKVIWAPRNGKNWGQGGRLGRSRDALVFYRLDSDPGETSPASSPLTIEQAVLFERLQIWAASGEENTDEDTEEDTEKNSAVPGPQEPLADDARLDELRALGYVVEGAGEDEDD